MVSSAGFAPIRAANVSSSVHRASRQAASSTLSRTCELKSQYGHFESFEGRVDGRLTFPPRGFKGFGYDPIFVPSGHSETYGELDPEYKHKMSHRALAFAKLIAACFQ